MVSSPRPPRAERESPCAAAALDAHITPRAGAALAATRERMARAAAAAGGGGAGAGAAAPAREHEELVRAELARHRLNLR